MSMIPFLCPFDRSGYSILYLTAQVPETKVQTECLELLNTLGIPASPVDVGGKTLRGRAYGALVRAGRKDLVSQIAGKQGAGIAGVPDLIGTIPAAMMGTPWGVPLYLEMKAPAWYEVGKRGALVLKRAAGSLTTEQRQFLTTMTKAGAVCGVCWSVGDLRKILDSVIPHR